MEQDGGPPTKGGMEALRRGGGGAAPAKNSRAPPLPRKGRTDEAVPPPHQSPVSPFLDPHAPPKMACGTANEGPLTERMGTLLLPARAISLPLGREGSFSPFPVPRRSAGGLFPARSRGSNRQWSGMGALWRGGGGAAPAKNSRAPPFSREKGKQMKLPLLPIRAPREAFCSAQPARHRALPRRAGSRPSPPFSRPPFASILPPPSGGA